MQIFISFYLNAVKPDLFPRRDSEVRKTFITCSSHSHVQNHVTFVYHDCTSSWHFNRQLVYILINLKVTHTKVHCNESDVTACTALENEERRTSENVNIQVTTCEKYLWVDNKKIWILLVHTRLHIATTHNCSHIIASFWLILSLMVAMVNHSTHFFFLFLQVTLLFCLMFSVLTSFISYYFFSPFKNP